MISPSITTWIYFGRQISRVVPGAMVGREAPGPIDALAQASHIPMIRSPRPCGDTS